VCDCVASGRRTRPSVYIERAAARRFNFVAAPLSRRALLGSALAATAMALNSSASAQRVPDLIWGQDVRPEPVLSEHLPRGVLRRRRPYRGGPPIAREGPSTLQWPNGMTEHRLALRNVATGDNFDGVIWVNGHFDSEALDRLNALMRDTHTGVVTRCDARLFDLLACVQTRIHKPFHIVSGFRTLQTNAALARHDPHVAFNSLHIRGMAADFYVEGVQPRQLAQQARAVGAGGVGLYVAESFVHVDTGPMRSWVY
jgi:uncharacterized protein YcbK (DUF882 family)